MTSQNSSGNMLFYMPLTSATIHIHNISPTPHHIRDGTTPNQTYLICKNLELPSGSSCRDRKNNRRCYQNQNDEFMLAMMMVLEQSNTTMQKCARYLPHETSPTLPLPTTLHPLKLSKLHLICCMRGSLEGACHQWV